MKLHNPLFEEKDDPIDTLHKIKLLLRFLNNLKGLGRSELGISIFFEKKNE